MRYSMSCARTHARIRLSFLLFAIGLLIVSLTGMAQANPLNVPSQFPTIQAAINAANPGDSIEVAPGTYTGSGNVDVVVNKPLTVEGTGGASQTLINCQGTSSANHRGFDIEAGNATVRGFTIVNGYVGGNGGGIVVLNSGTTLTINQCIFSNDHSDFAGGAISILNDSSVTVSQCMLIGNSAASQAAGIEDFASSLVCTDSIIAGNSSPIACGILIYGNASATITNCSISADSGNNGYGNGINIGNGNSTDTSSATITNCLLYGNSGVDLFVFDSGAQVTLSHSDVGTEANNGGTLNDDGTNINADPLFVSTSAPYDLHVQAGSPALGLGTTSAPNFPTTDLDGNAWATPPAAGAYQGSTASTSTALQSSTNPSSVGQNVTFTATVSNTTSGSSAVPAGSVQFFVDGNSTPVATVSLNGSAQATYSTSSLPMGSHTISASFVANSRFNTSTSNTVNQQVVGTPTANAQSVSTNESTAVGITLTGSDPDSPPLSLTYAYGQPAHGTVTGTAPNVTYTPTAGYYGPDSFTFTVSNGTNTSSPATVSITVTQVPTHLSVSTPSNATAGVPVNVTVTVLDDGNQVVTGYSDYCLLTSSDPRVTLPSSFNLTNGTGTTSVTFNTAGVQSLSASSNSLSGTTNVTVGSAPTGLPRLAIGGVSVSREGTSVTVQFTLTNSGNGEADNVHLTLAKLAGISANSLPSGITLGAGQVQTVSVTFLNPPYGTQTLQLTGSYIAASNGATGSFTSTQRVTVPGAP